MDHDPTWIQIDAIPIPALWDAILAPDQNQDKSGVMTPLEGTYYRLSVGVTGDPVSEAAADEVNKHAGRKGGRASWEEISGWEEELERLIEVQ